MINVNMMLCDYAVVAEGKLTVVGAGWSLTGPQPFPSAVGLLLEIPWLELNVQHTVVIELRTADGQPVELPSPVRVEAQLEAGRPAGHPHGVAITAPLAMLIPPLPLMPGARYEWVLTVDGQTEDDWRVGFGVRQTAPATSA